MIFLSHTHADKLIVNTIAQRLAQIFDKDKIFYDSWSIQPGDGIIDQMNTALEQCKYFFFFVSKQSLQSNMVKLEWQNALYKSTKKQIKIVPVKIDDCIMPSVLLQTLYIDIYGQGLETSVRQMIDVISGNNTYKEKDGFYNVRAYVTQQASLLTVEFKTEVYMEPHSQYIILINNLKDDIEYKAVGENSFNSSFRENIILSNGVTANGVLLVETGQLPRVFLLLPK